MSSGISPDGGYRPPSGAPSQPQGLRIWELIIVCAGSCLPVFLLKGISHEPALAALRLCLLAAAAASDMRTMHISNLYAAALLASGLCGGYDTLLLRTVFSLIFFAAFALFYRLRRGKTVGGADIKLLCALMFCLGPGDFCLLCAIICGLLLLCGACVLLLKKKEILKRRLPFAPFIWAGALILSLL